MSDDREFDDFLKRRRPLFRREVDDGLEPPAELDRIVLRQARDAIEGERPLRLFGMPRWAAPMAIAATLVVGLAMVFKAGVEPARRVPEVRVESVAQRIDFPARAEMPPPAPPPPVPDSSGAMVVDLASPMTPPAAARPDPSLSAAAAPTEGSTPEWRRDAVLWQAEIERLRASGDQARAQAEQAEFNRQFRAYAVSPDR